jgi:hypothetical protein
VVVAVAQVLLVYLVAVAQMVVMVLLLQLLAHLYLGQVAVAVVFLLVAQPQAQVVMAVVVAEQKVMAWLEQVVQTLVAVVVEQVVRGRVAQYQDQQKLAMVVLASLSFATQFKEKIYGTLRKSSRRSSHSSYSGRSRVFRYIRRLITW